MCEHWNKQTRARTNTAMILGEQEQGSPPNSKHHTPANESKMRNYTAAYESNIRNPKTRLLDRGEETRVGAGPPQGGSRSDTC